MTDAPAPTDRRLILVLVGAAGAGKGTQATALAKELGLAHLASGDLFRAALRDGSALGHQISGYMERGELVPDDITIRMFMDRLAQTDAARGAILDGFPRTVRQAEALDRTLAAAREGIHRVVYIEVPTEDLVNRVAGRWVCPTCGTPYHEITEPPRVPGRCDRDGSVLEQRADDRPDVVRARLTTQVPPMLEVVEHYRRAGRLDRVDGAEPAEAVTARILAGLRAGARA